MITDRKDSSQKNTQGASQSMTEQEMTDSDFQESALMAREQLEQEEPKSNDIHTQQQ
jgi:hypothetical protein